MIFQQPPEPKRQQARQATRGIPREHSQQKTQCSHRVMLPASLGLCKATERPPVSSPSINESKVLLLNPLSDPRNRLDFAHATEVEDVLAAFRAKLVEEVLWRAISPTTETR
jgi:hypothetical protein